MKTQVDAIKLQIEEFSTNLADRLKEGKINIIEAFKEYKSLESKKWWAEQGEKLENAKNATIDAFNKAGTWTKEHAQAAKVAISNWFDEMKQKMSRAWQNFKETVGQEWENFKGAMAKFGEKIAEMWSKAMDSLGKLWDEIKISAHNVAVDVKTGVLNLCTDMKYGVANLGIEMQKAGLAMDNAYQQVKGTISDKIADKFNESAGKLLVESKEVCNQVIKKEAEFKEMDFNGYNDKTVASAEKHQENVITKLQEQQRGLESKMQSRENIRDYMEGVKKGSDFKKDVFNVNRKGSLNRESHLNTREKNAKQSDRNTEATTEKKSYREKVEADRKASKENPGSRGL